MTKNQKLQAVMDYAKRTYEFHYETDSFDFTVLSVSLIGPNVYKISLSTKCIDGGKIPNPLLETSQYFEFDSDGIAFANFKYTNDHYNTMYAKGVI